MALSSPNSTNLGPLSTVTTAATALGGVVLAVANIFGSTSGAQNTIGYQPGLPQPTYGQNPNQMQTQLPPAFQFHYEGEQIVELKSDITDHYIEDNSAIQDQWSIAPEIISTHGFIGELNNIPTGALASVLGLAKSVTNTLSPLGAYIPGVSSTATLAYNEAFFLYQTASNGANAAVSAWSSINGGNGEAVISNGGITNTNLKTQSKQQIAFQQFYAYRANRVLFTVQTPWAVFTNCAINSLRAIQDAETQTVTDFEVSFKVIKTAQTKTLEQILEGRLAQQGFVSTINPTTPAQSGPSLLSTLGTYPSLGVQ